VKIFRILAGMLLVSVASISSSSASDFDWLDNLNVMAKADSSGFSVRLATRFHIGDAQIQTVIGNVGSPSDAYMVLRLGELSHRPINEVINVYHAHPKNGWGAMAKDLGIKPGSREFHALKRGHDMDDAHDHGGDRGRGQEHPSDKHHGKGGGMGKGKPW
jgi:hypothetical protein